MKYPSKLLAIFFSSLAFPLLLTGCAGTVRSEVTVFHEWPSDLRSKTFAFEVPKTQEVDLEYGSYQTLVANELKRLGFTEAGSKDPAELKVALEYRSSLRDVTLAQPVLVNAFPPYGWPYYARWRSPAHRAYFYDPFWAVQPVYDYREFDYEFYQRRMHIDIYKAADNKKVYEATVDNVGHQPSLAHAMPYMIRSAFADFPGKSGVPHRVDLKADDKTM